MVLASTNPYLVFGLDSDPVALCAGLLAGLSALIACSSRVWQPVARLPSRGVLLALCLVAAALSTGYIAYYLRGGPRIVDAAHYYLEGRALSHGYLSFPVPEPSASFRGRFLLSQADGARLGVLFPPGYPLALALAFWARAPLALGPLLAAALVFLTYGLARKLGFEQRVALAAAGLSVVSAALRYHTADTMSHGLAAVLLTGSVILALKESRQTSGLSGLAVGWLIATRPVTGVVALALLCWFLRGSRTHLVAFVLGLAPGLTLLGLHQAALTGDLLHSTQLAYYGVADGPPGCFRYGFGAGIGCLFEHGDYVRARLPETYGPWQALETTLRRLLVHSLDIANLFPLALGVPIGAFLGRRQRAVRLISMLVLGTIVAYAPFYFEGSYPGGGARFFADVLPLEHVLLAIALARATLLRWAWPAALAGFAFHTSSQHRALRDREGGRPMFEPQVLRAQRVERGLVLVSTDSGFALGHDPGRLQARDGIVVARARGDALDSLLWRALDRPTTYRYEFDPADRAAIPRLTPISIAEPRFPLRVEAEHLWPALAVREGWIHPAFPGEPCTSGGRALKLISTSATRSTVKLAVPNLGQPTNLRLGWVGQSPPTKLLFTEGGQTREIQVPREAVTSRAGCSVTGWLGPIRAESLAVSIASPAVGLLDYVELTPEPLQKDVDN